MNTFNFTYEVTEVDNVHNTMLVVYSCDGYESVTVSTRKPFAGEDIESVINAYAPTIHWNELDAIYDSSDFTGVSGSATHTLESYGVDNSGLSDAEIFANAVSDKKAQLAEARYYKEQSGTVTVDGIAFSTGRDTQAKIGTINSLISAGKYTETRWKCADGSFVQLTATLAESAYSEITAYVNDLFAWEESVLVDINASTTKADLDAISI